MLSASGSRTETLRDWRQALQRRSHWLFAAVVLWVAVLVARLAMVMVVQRSAHLARLETSAWRVGTVPALRGRVLDRDGVPLAWSVRSFRLTYRVPTSSPLITAEAQVLAPALGLDRAALLRQVLPQAGNTVVLRDQLPPADIARLRGLVGALDDCQLQSSFARTTAPGASPYLAQLGRTRVFGQREVGLSGWELEFDAKLRGQDGKYRVMVDKYDHWIPETWEELRPPSPGYDAYVTVGTGLMPSGAPLVATAEGSLPAATPAASAAHPRPKGARSTSGSIAATPAAFTPR